MKLRWLANRIGPGMYFNAKLVAGRISPATAASKMLSRCARRLGLRLGGATISGMANSRLFPGLQLSNNGGNIISVFPGGLNPNMPFSFLNPVANGAPYGVQVMIRPAGQTCAVANGSGFGAGVAVSNVSVDCI